MEKTMKTAMRFFVILGSALLSGCISAQLEEPEVCKTTIYSVAAGGLKVTGGDGSAGVIKILDNGQWNVSLDITLNPGGLPEFLSELTLKGGKVFTPNSPATVTNLDFMETLTVVLNGETDLTLLDYTREGKDIHEIDIPPRSENLLLNLTDTGVTIHFSISGHDTPTSNSDDGHGEVGLTICVAGKTDKSVNLLEIFNTKK